MQWWHEARFGMFIHFGLYSVLGRHEWAMEQEGIPVAEYQQLAKQFNPQPHAARAWAKLAKSSGMKYMVMTTKHHEGFCLFDTKLTNYCAPKQAAGRDLVAEYVDMGPWNIVVALLIAGTKMSLVIYFFMHVKFDDALTRLFAAAGFIWLIILLVLTLSDYYTRDWSKIESFWTH